MIQKIENDFNYNLDIPSKDGKEGYVGVHFTMFLKMASILQSPEFQQNPVRVFYLATEMISLIPDVEKREKIRKQISDRRRELIEEYKRDGITIDKSVGDHLLITASLETLGEITDYVDQHIGISTTNKIGWGITSDKSIIIKGSETDLKIKDLERKLRESEAKVADLERYINEQE